MSADVHILDCITRLPIPADRVLEQAPRDLDSVVVCGYDKDGVLYFSSSLPGGPDVLWLLEEARIRLMQRGGVIPKSDE